MGTTGAGSHCDPCNTVAARRLGALPPTFAEVQAVLGASEGRLELRSVEGIGEYQIRACQGHTGGTSLASLGQPLASHEPWMLHTTFLKHFKSIGLIPHGALVPAGRTPRQDLYLGMGTDPRARFPSVQQADGRPECHALDQLGSGWPAAGAGIDESYRHRGNHHPHTRVEATPLPRGHVRTRYLGCRSGGRLASSPRSTGRITAALSHWGAVTWPDDPAEYWIHEGEHVDEPVVASELSDALLGSEWPSPRTGEDFGLPAGEDPAAEADPDWRVDPEPSESNDGDEEAPSVPAPALSVPDEEGDPPVEEADPQQSEPVAEMGEGEEEEEEVGDVPCIGDRVAQALARRPDASGNEPLLPPWRDGSRPPRGAPKPKGGPRWRAIPPDPGDFTLQPAPIPKGYTDAQRARMGLSFSSAAGGPAARAYPSLGSNDGDLRAQLEEALRAAEESRVQAEAAQATARAVLERFESAAPSEPAPTRGQAAVARLETEARALTPGDGGARDRSRSARAMQQTALIFQKSFSEKDF